MKPIVCTIEAPDGNLAGIVIIEALLLHQEGRVALIRVELNEKTKVTGDMHCNTHQPQVMVDMNGTEDSIVGIVMPAEFTGWQVFSASEEKYHINIALIAPEFHLP